MITTAAQRVHSCSFDNLNFLHSELVSRFREHLLQKFDLREPFWCDADADARPRRASTGGFGKSELGERDVPLLIRRLHPTLTAPEYALLRTNPLFHAATFDACEGCFLTLTTGSAVAAPPNPPGWVSSVFESAAFLDASHFEVDASGGPGVSAQLSLVAEALLHPIDEGERPEHAGRPQSAGDGGSGGGERGQRLIIRCKNVRPLACTGALEAKAMATALAKAKARGASNRLAASVPKTAHAGGGGGVAKGVPSRPLSAMSAGSEDSAAPAVLPFAPARPASVPRLPLAELASLPGNQTRPKKRSPTRPKEESPPLRPVRQRLAGASASPALPAPPIHNRPCPAACSRLCARACMGCVTGTAVQSGCALYEMLHLLSMCHVVYCTPHAMCLGCVHRYCCSSRGRRRTPPPSECAC
jgi:hypothetical protein